MSRTTKYKIGYLLLIVVTSLITLCAFYFFKIKNNYLYSIAFLLFLSGRLQGYYFRDFYKALKLLSNKKYEESILQNQLFLQKIATKPYLKKSNILVWGIYTRDIEAMTYNNLGAAYLELAKLEEATLAFTKAINIDNLYPIPYYNLAVLYEIHKDRAKAEEYSQIAANYGFEASMLNFVI